MNFQSRFPQTIFLVESVQIAFMRVTHSFKFMIIKAFVAAQCRLKCPVSHYHQALFKLGQAINIKTDRYFYFRD